MKILNTNGEIIVDPDLTTGYLEEAKVFVAHHEATEAVEEQGHWVTVAEYPNGGKDVEWAVDVPGVQAREAYDEFETVMIFHAFEI